MKRVTFTALLLSFGLDAAPADLQQHVSDLWQQQDFAAAKEFLADKVNRKTKDAWLLAALGRSELELGQVENAEELLARAIKIDVL